ncbi:hypothetical protein ACRALDRAFT_210362 [Sodiomyces alcalophilus JCM 7366]|uniref:uncharacterized protein n=1 Tax=Sodiomyces alcalophilus JCM 7366 TaxID=591952 RepID=UPI0039B370DB
MSSAHQFHHPSMTRDLRRMQVVVAARTSLKLPEDRDTYIVQRMVSHPPNRSTVRCYVNTIDYLAWTNPILTSSLSHVGPGSSSKPLGLFFLLISAARSVGLAQSRLLEPRNAFACLPGAKKEENQSIHCCNPRPTGALTGTAAVGLGTGIHFAQTPDPALRFCMHARTDFDAQICMRGTLLSSVVAIYEYCMYAVVCTLYAVILATPLQDSNTGSWSQIRTGSKVSREPDPGFPSSRIQEYTRQSVSAQGEGRSIWAKPLPRSIPDSPTTPTSHSVQLKRDIVCRKKVTEWTDVFESFFRDLFFLQGVRLSESGPEKHDGFSHTRPLSAPLGSLAGATHPGERRHLFRLNAVVALGILPLRLSTTESIGANEPKAAYLYRLRGGPSPTHPLIYKLRVIVGSGSSYEARFTGFDLIPANDGACRWPHGIWTGITEYRADEGSEDASQIQLSASSRLG